MTTQSDQTQSSYSNVIDEALATAAWPDGERFIHLAAMHRTRVTEHVVRSLHAAGFRIVPNGEHLLHQEEDSWAMEHTVECRQRGLMQCDLHELACSGAWRDTAPGVYRIVDEPGLPVHLEDWP